MDDNPGAFSLGSSSLDMKPVENVFDTYESPWTVGLGDPEYREYYVPDLSESEFYDTV